MKTIKRLIETNRLDEITQEDIIYLADKIESTNNYACIKLLNNIYNSTNTIEKDIDQEKSFLHILGAMYYEGIIVEQDTKKAIEYLKKSLEDNESYSAYLLGLIYFEEKGVEQNKPLAKEYFKKGIELENCNIFFYIDYLLDNINNKEYIDDLIEITKTAIDNDFIDEIFLLGYIYDTCKYDYEKAYECYSYIAENKELFPEDVYESNMFQLGLLYLYGKYVKQDLEQAKKCFLLANDYQMINQIEYYLGNTNKLDFKNALASEKEIFSEEKDIYFKTLCNKVKKGTNIITISSLKELPLDKLQSINKDSLIFLNNQAIGANISTSLYTYNQMLEIIDACNEITKEIDLNQKEEDIFMQIYIKILERVESVIGIEENHIFNISYFNLYSLIDGVGVCAAFSIVLKTLLELVGIECNLIDTTKHQFNQVKVNNKWYYCDICWDKSEGYLDNCLKSKEDFCKSKIHIPYSNNNLHETNESYPNIMELYKKNLIKLYKEDYLEHDILNLLGIVKTKDNNS